MPTTIITKNGTGLPADSTVAANELAVDSAAGTLYTSTNGVDVVPIVGGGGGGFWAADGDNIYNTNSGDVGIGTTSPTSETDAKMLTINGTAVSATLYETDNTLRGSIGASGIGLFIDSQVNVPIVFRTQDTVTRLVITDDGDVLLDNNKRIVGTMLGVIDTNANISAGSTGDFSVTKDGIGGYQFTFDTFSNTPGSQSFAISPFTGGQVVWSTASNSVNTMTLQFAAADGSGAVDVGSFFFTRSYF
jgi:hypothetical protein